MGLITGLICVMYIFFWINNEVSYNHFNKNIDRIVKVSAYLDEGGDKFQFNGCPPAVAPAMKDECPEIENSCRYMRPYFEFTIHKKDQKIAQKVAFGDFSLFDIFSFPYLQGNSGDITNHNKVVITKKMASTLFPQQNPVGQTIQFLEIGTYTVTGVIDDIPSNSSIKFDMIIPMENLSKLYEEEGSAEDFLSTWYDNGFTTFGLLKSESGFEIVSSYLTKRIQKSKPESKNYLETTRFRDYYLNQTNHTQHIKMYSLIGLLILIASILNYINLVTAKNIKSAKSSAIRKSIGATKAQIIKLIYSEIFISCFWAFLISFIISIAGLNLFNHIINTTIHFSSILSPIPLLLLFIIFVSTVILSGLYPSFLLSKTNIVQTLKIGILPIRNKGIFRNLLIVSVLIISIGLLSSTYIIGKQISYMDNMDIGYQKSQLMYIKLNGELKNKTALLKEKLAQIPGINETSVVSNTPLEIGNNGEGWDWQGREANFHPLVTNWSGDFNLCKTLNAKMIDGDFWKEGETNKIVINKAFADLIGWDSFAGKSINGYGNDIEIAGVIDNIVYNDLSKAVMPMVIFPQNNASNANYILVRIEPKLTHSIIAKTQKIVTNIEPNYPINYSFVDQEFEHLLKTENHLKSLITVFSIFSILILCFGLLGVILFLSEQKAKEIGIRKSLGGEEKHIIIHLLKPIFIAGVLSCIIAIPITWNFMHHWLQGYTNRIHINIWYFIIPSFCVFFITIGTVIWHTWKAATTNPVDVLKSE